MEDEVEILAEPDEPGFFESLFSSVGSARDVLTSNGWYIVGLAAIAYYVYKNYLSQSGPSKIRRGRTVQSPDELAAKQSRDEARRIAVEKMQAKYQIEANERAEKLKQREEKKRLERIAELERLEASRKGGVGHALGSGNKSFRPEYNPLMGDTSSGARACARPSGGRQGG